MTNGRLGKTVYFGIALLATAIVACLPTTLDARPRAPSGVANKYVINMGELSGSEEKTAFDPKKAADEYFEIGTKRQAKALKYERKAAETDRVRSKNRYLKKARKSHETAISYFAYAADQDPDHTDAWTGLALSLLKAGGHREAVEVYDFVLTRRPNSARDIYHRGEAYIALGETESAKITYAGLTRLAELNGDHWRLVDAYMDEMLEWAAARQLEPGDMDPAAVDSFENWARETAKVASETYRWSLPVSETDPQNVN